MPNVFRDEREGRLRAFWRLLFQFALSFVGQSLLTTVALLVFSLTGGAGSAGKYTGLTTPSFVAVGGVISLAVTASSVWLAGRFLDRRPFSGFGLRLDRGWWLDLGFGVLLGALLMTAVFLVEYAQGRLKRAITFLVDVMTGIPSIVAGLFAYALFAIFLGPGIRLGIMGAIALSVLMIPVVVRSAEEVLKLVPNELREASYALGVPKWRTIVKVVIPTAIAGLGTGVTLAIARVVGETAPLLITLGITNATNLNAFDGRMATLPVYAYYQLTQPGVPPQFATDRAWTAALVLIILVMGLNVVARLISRFFAPKSGR